MYYYSYSQNIKLDNFVEITNMFKKNIDGCERALEQVEIIKSEIKIAENAKSSKNPDKAIKHYKAALSMLNKLDIERFINFRKILKIKLKENELLTSNLINDDDIKSLDQTIDSLKNFREWRDELRKEVLREIARAGRTI